MYCEYLFEPKEDKNKLTSISNVHFETRIIPTAENMLLDVSETKEGMHSSFYETNIRNDVVYIEESTDSISFKDAYFDTASSNDVTQDSNEHHIDNPLDELRSALEETNKCFQKTINTKEKMKRKSESQMLLQSIEDLFNEIFKSRYFIYFENRLFIHEINKYTDIDSDIKLGRHCNKYIKRAALAMRRYPYKELLNHLKINAINATKKYYPSYIFFLNCIYDVLTGKTIEHSPDIISFVCLPIEYTDNPTLYCPCFDAYIDTVTNGDSELRDLIMTMLAYFLLADCNDAKKFFVLIGPSGTGKSTFGNIVQSLMGEEVCSFVPLQNMGDTYSKYNLENKLVNISMDLSSETISRNDMSSIKIVTGGDRVYTQVRYEKEHCFYPTAKLLFGSNFPLTLAQYDEAFCKRLITIPFNVVIPEESQDKNLVQKISLEREAVINRLLPHAKKLLKNNMQFPRSVVAEQLKQQCINEKSDSLKKFIDEKCEFSYQHKYSSEQLYKDYLEYCYENDFKALSMPAFHDEMKKYPLTEGRWGITGEKNKQFRGYRGIKPKAVDETEMIPCIIGN